MTAALQYIQNIDPLYPHPGQDNNSQGFRNNFNNIQAALSNLDSYMNSLAATTLNVNAPNVTATNVLTAEKSLVIGHGNTQTTVSLAFLNNNLVVVGQNPDGSEAGGSVAFFPFTVPIGVIGYGIDTVGGQVLNYFVASNDTTNVLTGATFSTINNNTGTTYTVSQVSGQKVYFYPSSTSLDPVVNIVNPTFKNYTVINASTVTNLISQTLNGPTVTFSGNTPSDGYTNGTVVLTGQGGLGVGGDINTKGVINAVQGFVTSSTQSLLGGLTIAGSQGIDITDILGNLLLTISPSSFKNSLDDPNVSKPSGYQFLPGGIVLQWGLAPATGQSANFTYDFPIPFPTECFVIFSEANYALYVGTDSYTQGTAIVSRTQFTITQDYGQAQFWFAIGH
jgi:hypothetical protein